MLSTPLGVFAHNGGDDHHDNKPQHQQSQQNRGWFSRWHHKDKDEHEHNDQDAQKTCQERQDQLNQKVANFKAAAQRDVTFQSSFYGFLQTFVTDQNITVSNYDALKADVEAKQAAATQAVDAVTAPDLNCDEQSPDLDAQANDSMKQARQALRDYRQALRNLTKAIWLAYGSQMDDQ